jgi:hypothetical protein
MSRLIRLYPRAWRARYGSAAKDAQGGWADLP